MASWWESRKSRVGLSPVAREPPPYAPGRAWWTTPPTSLPQPEHIEYAVQYQLEIMRMPGSESRNALQMSIGAWLRAARRLLHEEACQQHGDLQTTDGILVRADAAINALISRCRAHGVPVDPREVETRDALSGRADRIRRERATASSRRVSRAYWEDDSDDPATPAAPTTPTTPTPRPTRRPARRGDPR